MSTKWCPKCRAEYREGFDVCGDCGVALVDVLPQPTDAHQHAGHQEPAAPFLPGDDVVELTTMGIVEAELVAAQLRGAGIPVAIFGSGLAIYTGVRRGRLMVRTSDLVDAQEFVAQL